MANLPTEPGYYWAKLKTPSYGDVFNVKTLAGEHIGRARIEPETDSDGHSAWCSDEWEIVRVNENDPCGDPADEEHFSVDVFGIPVVQWPLDFFWGPKIDVATPAEQPASAEGGR